MAMFFIDKFGILAWKWSIGIIMIHLFTYPFYINDQMPNSFCNHSILY